MEFGELVEVFEQLESTSSSLEKTDLLAELYREADPELLPKLVKLSRGKVFTRWKSEDLGVSSSLTLRAVSQATGLPEEQIENWWREEGDLGNGAMKAVAKKQQQTLFTDSLSVSDVHDQLIKLAQFEGEGSEGRRVDEIAGLISAATPREARYLVRLIGGAMRLGVGDGLVRDAIAAAFLDGDETSEQLVDEAFAVTNDYRIVAETALEEGADGLKSLDVEVFRPIKPMLAQKADSIPEALDELADADGEVLFETKYDGIRAKLHVDGDDVRMFTRRLEEVTEQFPEVIESVERLIDVESAIIEAEVVGYDPESGDVLPFQSLSRRIKRKYRIAELQEEVPVTVHVFDMLYHDAESILDEPLRIRVEKLEKVLTISENEIERANNLQTDSASTAREFYESILKSGHEGVMAKNLDATYQPGSRVGYQLKVKPTMEPLDLVVTRAKWSEGRKSDYLGRPYLACRDENGDFREVGRMHTGFTDEELENFHNEIEPLIKEISGREAVLSPEVVIEVEYEEIQESPKYDSGFALRFPRFKQIRPDLSPQEIDTLARVEELFEGQ